jgi:hypothetical protein
LEDADELAGGLRLRCGRAADGWKLVESGIDEEPDVLRRRAGFAQDRNDDSPFLLEQDGEQVLGGDLGVAATVGHALRSLNRLL